MPNLRLQGATYHARLTIPKDVRNGFGNKHEFSQSLGTGSLKLAKERCAEVITAWKRDIRQAREGKPGFVVDEWIKVWAKEIRDADTDTETYIDENPFTGEPMEFTTHSDRETAQLVMTEDLERLVVKGHFPEDEIRAAVEIASGKRIVLEYHIPDFLKQYTNHNIKTQSAYSKALEHFLERFKEAKQVTPRSLKAWMSFLSDEKELGAETIGRLLRTSKAFWDYMVEHEIVSSGSNPFTGVKLSVPKTAKRSIPISPFDPQEIVSILHSPTALGDPQLSLLITLAMYTGARIEELAMLRWSDVDINTQIIIIAGTKTKAAKREVPIHPVLLPLLSSPHIGNDNDGYVIPSLTIDKRGERGKALGKRFGRLKTSMGFTGREKCFHSIRKTFVTLLERARIMEGVTADIVGHEKQTITYGLYSGGSSMEQKREAIAKITYPTLSRMQSL